MAEVGTTADETQELSKEGRLSKWVNLMQGWQHRYVVLDGKLGILSYYTSREKMRSNQRRGCIRLKHAIVGIETEDGGSFTVKTGDKTFYLMAQTARERDDWIQALEEVIRFQNTLSFNLPFVPDFDAFETNLRNTDALMEMMIDKVRDLRKRCDSTSDEAEKNRLRALINSSSEFVESLKHCMIILQIAKNKCQIRLAREGYEERIGFDLTCMNARSSLPGHSQRLPHYAASATGSNVVMSSMVSAEDAEAEDTVSDNYSGLLHAVPGGGSGDNSLHTADDEQQQLGVAGGSGTLTGTKGSRRSGVPPESFSSDDEFYDAEESLDEDPAADEKRL